MERKLHRQNSLYLKYPIPKGDAGTVEASYQPFSTIPYLLRLDIANDKLRPFRFISLYSNALFYRINRFKSHCI
jgi:hypothetical protein